MHVQSDINPSLLNGTYYSKISVAKLWPTPFVVSLPGPNCPPSLTCIVFIFLTTELSILTPFFGLHQIQLGHILLSYILSHSLNIKLNFKTFGSFTFFLFFIVWSLFTTFNSLYFLLTKFSFTSLLPPLYQD